MIRFTLTLFSLLSFLLFVPQNVQAQEFNDAQKAEIKKLFEEYLMDNGGLILQSVNKYQADIEEQDRIEAGKKAEGFLKELDNKKNLPMTGSKDADITIVEFFDYNCGYCRQALGEIQTVLKDDDKVRVIFIDMPILGPESMEASKWSLAALKQDKYFEYHTALMEHNGSKGEEALEGLAKDIGLDVKQMKKDKDSEEIANALSDNVEQARAIGINGTPGFLLAGQLFPGFMPADRIKEIIAEHRKK